MHVKKNDTVVVLSGQHKGKKGRVIKVDLKNHRLIVEKINVVKRHKKGDKTKQQAGIIEKEAWLDSSKVALYSKEVGGPVRTKKGLNKDGKKVRVGIKHKKETKDVFE